MDKSCTDSIIQDKDVIPDTHFFLYRNKKYPFKFDYFKYASKFFSENVEDLIKMKTINLIDPETEDEITISDNAIKDFINYVQGKKINLTEENVFNLNYLSNKYDVTTLKAKTAEFITKHQEKLALELLYQHQNDSNFNSFFYEGIISNNFEYYLNDARLFDIKIPILYRIINSIQYKNKNKEFHMKLNEFLLKFLKKSGRSASVLFEKVEFGETRTEILKILFNEYSDIFDFQYISSTLIKAFIDFDNDKTKIKNHYEHELASKTEEINQLKQQNQGLLDEKNKIHQEMQRQSNEYSEKVANLSKKIEDLSCSSIPLLYDKNKNNVFDGIINYLAKKTGNIHDTNVIEVTSSPYQCNPNNLLDFNDGSFFFSKQTNNTFICYDFKSKKIKITNYSIRSEGDRKDTHHLKSWIIEVSNDCDKWLKIDEQKNCSILNGNCLTGTFDVKPNDFSRYVRLMQTDKTWGGDGYLLALNYIEFYGYIKE